MTDKKPIYSLSISGRIVLDMHSLNNEGGEGNQIATRMVNVVYKDRRNGEYKLATVNAISGDMFKHIQAEHLYFLARKMGLPLCAGCQRFSASRILDDVRFINSLERQDHKVVDNLLTTCVLDDLEGTLIAKGARSVPRKSVAEFGWVIGVPEYTTTDSYFHVRYASERGERAEDVQQQAIFHRPASSGVYAIVANFEIARIGYNDITQKYAINEDSRLSRYQALMESVLYTLIEPNGAMRGTQNPHIVHFEGVVTATHDVMPAPALSSINDDYRGQLDQVIDALGRLKSGAIAAYHFNSTGEFAQTMQQLIEVTDPYRIPDFAA